MVHRNGHGPPAGSDPWAGGAVRPHPSEVGREDGNVRAAARFALAVAVGAVAFLVVAALWASTCGGAAGLDTAACGPVQRTLLALGSPVVLLIGGLWAFGRTYQTWRRNETWWGWQGAGWFLFSMMMLVLVMGLPAIAGPAILG
jgi:hypothetical protein